MLGWLSSIGDAIATFLSFASSMLSGILSVFWPGWYLFHFSL